MAVVWMSLYVLEIHELTLLTLELNCFFVPVAEQDEEADERVWLHKEVDQSGPAKETSGGQAEKPWRAYSDEQRQGETSNCDSIYPKCYQLDESTIVQVGQKNL